MKRHFLFIAFLMVGFALLPGETILFIGDSITDGNWGSPTGYPCSSDRRNKHDLNHVLGHGYVEMTAGYLSGEYPTKGYEFINRGISGETLGQIISRWDKDVEAFSPSVVSLLCGTNDIHYWLEKTPEAVSDFDFAGYEERLDSLVSVNLTLHPERIVVLCTPFVAKAGYAGEAADFSLRKEGVDSIAAVTRKVAERYAGRNVYLVDFNALLDSLLKENPEAGYWVWDGIHPTTAMHHRMSRFWLGSLAGTGVLDFCSDISTR